MDDTDLDAAAAAGVIDTDTKDRLLAFLRSRRGVTVNPDEENFRLVTSFNDIFVSIACGLVFVAIGTLAPLQAVRAGGPGMAAAAALAAVIAWVMAEYFTRRQRMALPSILLLLVFVGAASICGLWIVGAVFGFGFDANDPGMQSAPERFFARTAAITGTFAVAAAAAHWCRFHVPITIAAGTAGISVLALSFFGGTGAKPVVIGMLGLAVFAEAMWFDMRDRLRTTRRADIAFWLHLLAAPMIVHPLLSPAGILASDSAVTLVVFAILTLIAVVIDRRALMVSSLIYVIVALNTVIGAGQETISTFGLTALFIGLFLVMLAAVWKPLRSMIVSRIPTAVARRVPEIRPAR